MLSNKRSKKRFGKMIDKFVTRIEHNLPIVVKNDEKIAELHELRKDCKKLRYLLELLPDNIGKGQSSDKDDYVPKLIEKLENVQDILGIIHDYDIILAYLSRRNRRGPRTTIIHSILEKIKRERQDKFKEFVEFVNGSLSANNFNFSFNFSNRMTNVLAR